MPLVAVCESPFQGATGMIKRFSDLALASAALVVSTPVMLAIAIGVKLSSPGPVLFRQIRYGLDGREIRVWKFRSMRVMENGGTIRQATKDDDPRHALTGDSSDRTSLDELPQIFNVLQGRMRRRRTASRTRWRTTSIPPAHQGLHGAAQGEAGHHRPGV